MGKQDKIERQGKTGNIGKMGGLRIEAPETRATLLGIYYAHAGRFGFEE